MVCENSVAAHSGFPAAAPAQAPTRAAAAPPSPGLPKYEVCGGVGAGIVALTVARAVPFRPAPWRMVMLPLPDRLSRVEK